MALSYLLSSLGGVRCEFTVFRVRENDDYLVSACAFERHDGDVLQKLLPKDGSVTLRTITTEQGVLVPASSRSRDVLKSITGTSLAHADFHRLSGQRIDVDRAEANALRVDFVGELGWERHHPIHLQNAVFDAVMEAGEPHGNRPFDFRAMARCVSRSPTGSSRANARSSRVRRGDRAVVREPAATNRAERVYRDRRHATAAERAPRSEAAARVRVRAQRARAYREQVLHVV